MLIDDRPHWRMRMVVCACTRLASWDSDWTGVNPNHALIIAIQAACFRYFCVIQPGYVWRLSLKQRISQVRQKLRSISSEVLHRSTLNCVISLRLFKFQFILHLGPIKASSRPRYIDTVHLKSESLSFCLPKLLRHTARLSTRVLIDKMNRDRRTRL